MENKNRDLISGNYYTSTKIESASFLVHKSEDNLNFVWPINEETYFSY